MKCAKILETEWVALNFYSIKRFGLSNVYCIENSAWSHAHYYILTILLRIPVNSRWSLLFIYEFDGHYLCNWKQEGCNWNQIDPFNVTFHNNTWADICIPVSNNPTDGRRPFYYQLFIVITITTERLIFNHFCYSPL